jgi:hypothetical protein
MFMTFLGAKLLVMLIIINLMDNFNLFILSLIICHTKLRIKK